MQKVRWEDYLPTFFFLKISVNTLYKCFSDLKYNVSQYFDSPQVSIQQKQTV